MSDDEVAEESNMHVFQNLQLHSIWDDFFFSISGDGMNMDDEMHW